VFGSVGFFLVVVVVVVVVEYKIKKQIIGGTKSDGHAHALFLSLARSLSTAGMEGGGA
jgi:hypothetical protein